MDNCIVSTPSQCRCPSSSLLPRQPDSSPVKEIGCNDSPITTPVVFVLTTREAVVIAALMETREVKKA